MSADLLGEILVGGGDGKVGQFLSGGFFGVGRAADDAHLAIVDVHLLAEVFGDDGREFGDDDFDGGDVAFGLEEDRGDVLERAVDEGRWDDDVDIVAFADHLVDVARDIGAGSVDISLAEVERVVFFFEEGGDGFLLANPPVDFAVFLFEEYFDDCGGPAAAS